MTLCLAVGWRECQCFQNLSCSVGIFSLSKTIITTLCNTARISHVSIHSRLMLGALIALSIPCIHALAKGSLLSLLMFYSWDTEAGKGRDLNTVRQTGSDRARSKTAMPCMPPNCTAHEFPLTPRHTRILHWRNVSSAAARIRLGQPKWSFSRHAQFQESCKSSDVQSLAPKYRSGLEDQVSLLGTQAQLSLRGGSEAWPHIPRARWGTSL